MKIRYAWIILLMATTIDFSQVKRFYNDVYWKTRHAPQRIKIKYGGSSSGKSVSTAQERIEDAFCRKGCNALALRKVDATVEGSVFSELLKVLNTWKLMDQVKINNTKHIITFPNQNKIICGGLDDPEKIKSKTFVTGPLTHIWFEEATESKKDDLIQCLLRLRGKWHIKKQLELTFNPINHLHHIKKDYFDRERNDTFIMKTTYLDNLKYLDQEDIDTILSFKEHDEQYYQVYALGNWGVLGNLIFTDYKQWAFPYDENDFNTLYVGVDFGFNDPTAIVKAGIKDSEIYILDEIYVKEKINKEIIEIIKPFTKRGQLIICDSAEPARIQEFRMAGLNASPTKKGKDSIIAGIDWLKGFRINIHPRCQNLFNEIQQYKYREVRGEVKDREPVDFDNHAMDALRYAFEPVRLQTGAKAIKMGFKR